MGKRLLDVLSLEINVLINQMICPSNPNEKLILALDGMDKEETFLILDQLPNLLWVKVGLELFVSEGPQILAQLKNRGLKIFLDLKFHDIPATMRGACRKAAKYGVDLISVHACAGTSALFEANEAAKEGAVKGGFPPPTLLAVTILTSWGDDKYSKELIINQSIKERVKILSELAFKSGIGGCVCSSDEVNALRQIYPLPFELITPGIRLTENSFDDQSRISSPSFSINNGASRIVVGRPITRAKTPELELNRFYKDISSCS